VDLLFQTRSMWNIVEIKSGATVAGDWFSPLERFARRIGSSLPGGQRKPVRKHIVYGGDEGFTRQGCHVVPWHEVSSLRVE